MEFETMTTCLTYKGMQRTREQKTGGVRLRFVNPLFLFCRVQWGGKTGKRGRGFCWLATQGGSRFAPLPWLFSCCPFGALDLVRGKLAGRAASGKVPLPTRCVEGYSQHR